MPPDAEVGERRASHQRDRNSQPLLPERCSGFFFERDSRRLLETVPARNGFLSTQEKGSHAIPAATVSYACQKYHGNRIATRNSAHDPSPGSEGRHIVAHATEVEVFAVHVEEDGLVEPAGGGTSPPNFTVKDLTID